MKRLTVRAVVVASVVGVVAALGFGLAPVQQDPVVFEFAPSDGVPGGDAASASLALAPGLVPDGFDLSVSCDAGEPVSTFRSMDVGVWLPVERGAVASPLVFEGLGDAAVVTVGGGEVGVWLGDEELVRVPVVHGPGCVVGVVFDSGEWVVTTPHGERSMVAGAATFADVSFVGPAAGSSLSSITVFDRELGSSPSLAQYLFLVVALGGVVFAVRGVVALTGGPKQQFREAGRLRAWLGTLGVVDAGVLVMLVVWAVLIPPSFDDGWFLANATGQEPFDGLDVVFQQGLADFLWGHWAGWLQYLWFGVSDSVAVLRLPNVVLGAVTWFGLRSMAGSLGLARRGAWLWVMGSVFVVGYGAWGMALRTEPIVAALFVASLALALRFASGQRGWVLVLWVAVVALAVNAHPSGLVTAAPALVLWRQILEWVRSDRAARLVGVSLVLLLGASTLLLYSWDSSLRTQLDGFLFLRSGTHRRFVFEELQRYSALSGTSSLRRVSVVLMLVGVVVFLLRRYGGKAVGVRRRDVPVWSVVVALGLLAVVPSKHTWHFGVLVGVASLAVVVAMRSDEGEDGSLLGGLSVPVVGVLFVGLSAALGWVWSSPDPWALFDLRTQRWWEGAVNLLPFDLSSPTTWLVGVGVLGGVGWLWRRRHSQSSGVVAEGFVVVAAALAVVVTAATFGLDALRTDGWTFGRQNVESLFGAAGCGLGDEIRIPEPGSLRVLAASPVGSVAADEAADAAGFGDGDGFVAGGFPSLGINGVLPLAGMDPVGSWTDDGSQLDAGFRSDWYLIGADVDAVAVMVMGGLVDGNAVAVEWGSVSGSSVESLGIVEAEVSGRFSDWTMLSFDPADGADAVRVMARDRSADPGLSGWVALSAPLGMSRTSIADIAHDHPTFITPPLMAYVPCAGVPPVSDPWIQPTEVMIREVPKHDDYIVWPRSDRAAPYLAAASSDRYFSLLVSIPPAATGDRVEVLVSQQYLTGQSARTTDTFNVVTG